MQCVAEMIKKNAIKYKQNVIKNEFRNVCILIFSLVSLLQWNLLVTSCVCPAKRVTPLNP